MYFDDFQVGDTFDIEKVEIRKDKMLAFAEEYDPQPIHLDEEFGANSQFGEIIAPGIMSFMSVWSKFVKANIITENFIAARSFRINWSSPVFEDDVLFGKVIIKNLIPRNKYNGLVEVNLVIYNQGGTMVMDTTTEAILRRRQVSCKE